jgi:hypothetical protein
MFNPWVQDDSPIHVGDKVRILQHVLDDSREESTWLPYKYYKKYKKNEFTVTGAKDGSMFFTGRLHLTLEETKEFEVLDSFARRHGFWYPAKYFERIK